MPVVSLVVLALYVFLQSAPAFQWFTVDPKLLGFVGIVFVLLVVVELVFYVRSHPNWYKVQG